MQSTYAILFMFHHDTTIVVEEASGDLEGEPKKGFGGISKASKLPSSISIALLTAGLCHGSVCMHHKPTTIIFLAISPSSGDVTPCNFKSSSSNTR